MKSQYEAVYYEAEEFQVLTFASEVYWHGAQGSKEIDWRIIETIYLIT